jgi:uncharacterized cupin superfamily protein
MAHEAFDLSKTFVHLGLGSTAVPLPNFSWTPEYMMAYLRAHLGDRDERRLVGIVEANETWTHWECHTGGDEIVVQLTGRSDIVQEIDGIEQTIALTPGQAAVNPRGVWHTSTVHEPGNTLFIAAGRRTTYRARSSEHDRP